MSKPNWCKGIPSIEDVKKCNNWMFRSDAFPEKVRVTTLYVAEGRVGQIILAGGHLYYNKDDEPVYMNGIPLAREAELCEFAPVLTPEEIDSLLGRPHEH